MRGRISFKEKLFLWSGLIVVGTLIALLKIFLVGSFVLSSVKYFNRECGVNYKADKFFEGEAVCYLFKKEEVQNE